MDGFPRTPAQAEALAVEGIKADCFLFLNVPDEMLVERVVGRRTGILIICVLLVLSSV